MSQVEDQPKDRRRDDAVPCAARKPCARLAGRGLDLIRTTLGRDGLSERTEWTMSTAPTSNETIRLAFPSTPSGALGIVQQCDRFLRRQGVTDTTYPCLMLLELIKKALYPGNADVAEHSIIVSVDRLIDSNFCVGVQDVNEQGVCMALNAHVTGGGKKEPKPETAMLSAFAEQVRLEEMERQVVGEIPKQEEQGHESSSG